MALIKKHVKQDIAELPTFSNLEDSVEFFHTTEDESLRDYVVEEIAKFHNGPEFLIVYIHDHDADKKILTKIASVISSMDADEAPIELIMDLLKLENAYVRNLGISILRNFGSSIKYYIVKFLIGEDKDLRIFAINVLGDVDFA